jgi:ribonuclease-3
MNLSLLENNINYEFKNKTLLINAITHSSLEGETNYENLEFLGDSILGFLVAKYLYQNFSLTEGDMSKTRASYVCESACVKYAEAINYRPYIRVGHGQLNNINDTIVADIFEAIMGCIYLDQGLEAAKKVFEEVVIPCVKNHSIFLGDYKSKLQELVQTTKKSLEYKLVGESGPAHDKVFEVEVTIDNIIYGRGTGKSKKEAEQKAAMDAYNKQARL